MKKNLFLSLNFTRLSAIKSKENRKYDTVYMQLFNSCVTVKQLSQLHAHLLTTSLLKNPLASTKLIQSYSELGSLQSAMTIFESFPKPVSFMFGLMIKCNVWSGSFSQAITLYHQMTLNNTHITILTFSSVLRACSHLGNLGVGRNIHCRIIKSGFNMDPIVMTSLVCLYGETGRLDDAHMAFDETCEKDVVSWSSIISSYVKNGRASEGINISRQMFFEIASPDSVIMLGIVEACTELASMRLAKSVHGYIVRNKLEKYGPLENSLVSMYSQIGDLDNAERLFKNSTIPRSNTSWTAMIFCYYQNGFFREALSAFSAMQMSRVEPNSVTMMGVICSCASLGWLREGKSVHCFVIRRSRDPEVFDFLGPSLIDFYADCGHLEYCFKVFDYTLKQNIKSWNVLISVYAREGLSKEGLLLFVQMHANGFMPDPFTVSSSLSACGNMRSFQFGTQIHSRIIIVGFSNEYTNNSLLDMYSKCGLVDYAYTIFNEIPAKSIVSWNSMICGFSQNGFFVQAVSLFHHMYTNRLNIDKVTFLIVIQACSQLSNLEKGKWVHHKLVNSSLNESHTDTALTDMYAKCGDIKTAQTIFNGIPENERNVVSWSTMIACYGMHGHTNSAISLFTRMVESGISPNNVTFLNILSACRHTRSVDDAKFYFNLMSNFGVKPEFEHYVCMVDLLSQAGDMNEAYKIMGSMPFRLNATVWGAMLNGCRIHGTVDMIDTIQKGILGTKIEDAGHYALLSNIYAEGGNLDAYGKVRSMMRSSGLQKVPGYSTI